MAKASTPLEMMIWGVIYSPVLVPFYIGGKICGKVSDKFFPPQYQIQYLNEDEVWKTLKYPSTIGKKIGFRKFKDAEKTVENILSRDLPEYRPVPQAYRILDIKTNMAVSKTYHRKA